MKLKSAIKYRYYKTLRISGVFYILMLELLIGSVIIRNVTKSTFGLDNFFPYIMYCFTFGIGAASYSKELNLFLQNGVPRQHMHWSFLALLPINLAFALISVLDDLFFLAIEKGTTGKLVTYGTTHMFHFLEFVKPNNIALELLTDLILIALCYCVLMSFGYMLGAIVRSLKTIYKIIVIVIIVVIGALLFAISLIDDMVNEHLVIIIRAFFGGNCYADLSYISNFVVASIICTAICVSVAHLLIRKATLKRGGDKK